MKISLSSYLLVVAILLFSSVKFYAQPDVFGRIEYAGFIDSTALRQNLEQLKVENPRQYAMLAPLAQEFVRIAANLSFELSFNSNEAVCEMVDEASALVKTNSSPLARQIIVTMFGGDKQYYLNTAGKIRLFEYKLGNDANVVHVEESFNKFNWKLTDETRTIGKYVCRKATGFFEKDTHCCGPEKIPVVAWFTPELPFPYGPMGIDGLPGLILELVIEHKTYRGFSATAIDIQTRKDAQVQSKMHKPIQVMTEQEFSEYAAQRMRRLKQRQ